MTKFEKCAAIFIAACLLVLVVGAGYKIGHRRGYDAGWRDCLASIQVDTTHTTDTSSYINPEPVIVEPVETTPAGYVLVKAGTVSQLKARIAELEAAALAAPVDAAPAPVDSIPVEVPLQVERKVYQDSTYRAVVEGIQARLAEIQTFNTTTTITKIVKEPVLPKFILSPSALASFDPGGLTVGAGLSADVWVGRWQLGADCGYGLRYQDNAMTPGIYARAVAKYNLFKY